VEGSGNDWFQNTTITTEYRGRIYSRKTSTVITDLQPENFRILSRYANHSNTSFAAMNILQQMRSVTRAAGDIMYKYVSHINSLDKFWCRLSTPYFIQTSIRVLHCIRLLNLLHTLRVKNSWSRMWFRCSRQALSTWYRAAGVLSQASGWGGGGRGADPGNNALRDRFPAWRAPGSRTKPSSPSRAP
jgi:hypothetical protein